MTEAVPRIAQTAIAPGLGLAYFHHGNMRFSFIAKAIAAAALLLPGWLSAQPAGAAAPSTPASRAAQAYREWRDRHESQPTNPVAAWRFASACFDQCEFSRSDDDRARFANQGIAACRQALSSDPTLAPAHYYLGMNLAQLARTKLIGALSLLGEVESEWEATVKLDENFDYAGPDRNLGLLYRDAPGWPLSLGSRVQARQHLLRAVSLHPEYPENHLNLIEAYLKWNSRSQAALAAKTLEEILPEARKKLAGPAWESSWDDWNPRWKAIQSKLSQPPGFTPPHARK
jgi:tetratricopeptide (TPR) repeat protein